MIRRVAMLSVHTSPLDAPGGGDAGGMNVYILETSRRLADAGIAVEVFTRATSSDQPPRVEAHPGVLVRHVAAGPFEGLCKEDLPAQLCAFAAAVLRAEARHEPGWYDVIHSHYWLSGQVGWLARDRWSVPLVHNAHTLGRVKNAALAEDDTPEPFSRIAGEQQVVAEADRLVASTEGEARDLIRWYGADPSRISVVPRRGGSGHVRAGSRRARAAGDRAGGPGRDLRRPHPAAQGSRSCTARRCVASRHGSGPWPPPPGARTRGPERNGPRPSATGFPISRRGSDWPTASVFAPPVDRATLADYYRASDLTIVPSYNESFGLVALESEACGTPVVAARVGGLPTSVADGVSGVLVDGHDPDQWAKVIGDLLRDSARQHQLGLAARRYAEGFSWRRTTDGLLRAYQRAIDTFEITLPEAVGD